MFKLYKLHSKLLIFVIPFYILTVAAMTIFFNIVFSNQLREIAYSDAKKIAQYNSSRIKNIAENHIYSLKTLYTMIKSGVVKDGSKADFDRSLKIILDDNRFFESVYVVFYNHGFSVSSAGNPLSVADNPIPDYLNNNIDGLLEVSKPFFIKEKGALKSIIIKIVIPVKDNNGNLIAVVGGDLDVMKFQSIISGIKPYRKGFAALLSDDGIRLAHLRRDFIGTVFWDYTDLSEGEKLVAKNRLSNGLDYLITKKSFTTGEDSFIYFYPVYFTGLKKSWSIGIVIPISAILGKVNALSAVFLLIGLAIMVTGTSFFIYYSARITRPISQLTRSILDIAAGNYNSRVQIHSSDEVGNLSRSFNLMSDKLSSSIDKLNSSNERFKIAQNVAKITSYELDHNTGELNWTQEPDLLFNQRVSSSIPDFVSFSERIHPEDRDRVLNSLSAVLSNGGLHEQEYRIKLSDGDYYWISEIGKLNGDGTGNFIGVIQDISQKKMFEDRFRQSQKLEAVGTLAGGIAHDFNNILAAIYGSVELARLRDSYDEAKEDLDNIKLASTRAKELIGQILTFSRLKSNESKVIDVNQAVKEVVSLLRSSIPLNIAMTVGYEESSPQIWGNSTEIHQILLNICTNAYQAMKDRGGKIDINISVHDNSFNNIKPHVNLKKGKYIKISVADNGPGISPDIIGKIFDPFFTTKGVGDGTGLGLSVVHGIVRNYQGEITVYSEEGKGAVFNVFLPLYTETEELLRPENESTDSDDFIRGSGTILLIDDEKLLLEINSLIIGKMGYDVIKFSDGIKALEFIRSGSHFDCAIIDQSMPDITGIEIASEIKKIAPSTPVIICSGFSEKITADNYRSLGIDEFIMKPFNVKSLLDTIYNVMNKK